MNTPATVNLCPLCGANNQCAMEIERETGVKQAPCWCTTIAFDAALLARIPKDKRDVACVCAKCAELGKKT